MRKFRIYYAAPSDAITIIKPSEWLEKKKGVEEEKILSRIVKLFLHENEWFIVSMDDLINEGFDISTLNRLVQMGFLDDELELSDGRYLSLTQKALKMEGLQFLESSFIFNNISSKVIVSENSTVIYNI